MILETLTISRLLERILRKEFHKVQDVVKKKTKAVEKYRPSRHCRIGFKSNSVMFSVFTSFLRLYPGHGCFVFSVKTNGDL